MHNASKFFVNIEKAFEEDGCYYVQGVASGTLEDRDGQRMSRQVMTDFAAAMPLPLTNGHPKGGPVDGHLGEVISATILNDDACSLFIKAQLDMDNPNNPYLIKQIQRGKKFAFSIEGLKVKAEKVYSDRLGRYVTEYQKVEPRGISITSQPSYTPSFLEVVTKAYEKDLSVKNIDMPAVETIDKSNLNNDNNPMKTNEKTTQTTEETLVETTPEETVTDNVAETAEEVPTTEEAPISSPEEVKSPEVDKAVSEENSQAESTSTDADPKEKMSTLYKSMSDCLKAMQSMGYGDVNTTVEEPVTQPVESMNSQTEKSYEEELVTKSYFDDSFKEFKNMFENLNSVAKSLHDDIEAVKTLPLQKKSMIRDPHVVAKAYEERQYSSDPTQKFVEKYKENYFPEA